jgi:hypothetical protein
LPRWLKELDARRLVPPQVARWRTRRARRDEDLVWFRSRDADENAESRLTDRERFEVAAVWVAEVFTPSTINKLREGIDDMGWSLADGPGRVDVEAWLDRAQRSGGSGWINLGQVGRAGAYRLGIERYADLSPTVLELSAVLHSLENGLIALLVGFALAPAATDGVVDALSKDFATFSDHGPRYRRRTPKDLIDFLTTRGRVRQMHLSRQRKLTYFNTPKLQRQKQGRAALNKVTIECEAWMRRHFQGAFASGWLDGSYPTCELLLFEDVVPFIDHQYDSALNLMKLDDITDVLRGSHESLRMKVPEAWPYGRDEVQAMFKLSFAVRREDAIPAETHKVANDRLSSDYIAHDLSDQIEPVLVRWTYHALVAGAEEKLGESRNTTARDYGNSRRVMRPLTKLRTFVAVDAADMLTVARAAQCFTAHKRRFFHNVGTWRWTADYLADQPPFVAGLRKSVQRRARRVEAEVQAHLSITSTVASLVSSRSQVRVARIALVVAGISLIVSVGSLILAYVAIKK